MAIKLVIFDLDGTITQPFFDFDAIRQEMGLAKDAGPVLEQIEKMTPEQREKAEKILASHEKEAVERSELNSGARSTLDSLRSAGIRIAVLTRNKRANVLAVAAKHGLKFDAVVGRDEGPVKPDAFGVMRLCRKFAVRPQQTMVVGDYLFDMLSARSAGAVPVLLANHKKANEFSQHADFVIEKVSEVLQVIEEKRE